MSSGDQGLKTKHEVLKEYEKGYLDRLEKKEGPEEKPIEEPKVEANIPMDLQNLIVKLSAKFETSVSKEYIGHCVVCLKKVERNKMVYKNNHLFHSKCFNQHGNEYEATTDLVIEGQRARVDLALFKNLKVRISNSSQKSSNRSKKKSSTKRKLKRKLSKKKRSSKRRTSKKKTTRKRKRKSRRKVKRTATKRKISRKRRPVRKSSIRRKKPKRRTSRRKLRRRR